MPSADRVKIENASSLERIALWAADSNEVVRSEAGKALFRASGSERRQAVFEAIAAANRRYAAELLSDLEPADQVSVLTGCLESSNGSVKRFGLVLARKALSTAEHIGPALTSGQPDLMRIASTKISPSMLPQLLTDFPGSAVQSSAKVAFGKMTQAEQTDVIVALLEEAKGSQAGKKLLQSISTAEALPVALEAAVRLGQSKQKLSRELSSALDDLRELNSQHRDLSTKVESFESGIQDGRIHVKTQWELDEENAQILRDMTR